MPSTAYSIAQSPPPTVWLARTRFADFGWICLAVTERGLHRLEMVDDPRKFEKDFSAAVGPRGAGPAELASEAARQIEEYLAGERHEFALPLDQTGMGAFQQHVLAVTTAIPFGCVLTYAEVAHRIGHPQATRAVGAALGANPIPIVIPCHRVVGSDHRLHGFGAPGGINTKAWLLEREGFAFSSGRILLDQNRLF